MTQYHPIILQGFMIFFAVCIVIWIGFFLKIVWLGEWNNPEWDKEWWGVAYEMFISVLGFTICAITYWNIT